MERVVRRRFVLQAAPCLLLASRAAARAEGGPGGFPSKPIRLVVPYPPGGATDIQARVLAREIQVPLGQPVIVENRPGASGVTGSDAVARAPADGHTLLMGSSASHGVSVIAMPGLPFDPLRDFAPVSLIAKIPNVLVVHPSLATRSLGPLVDHLRANPRTPIATSGPTASGRFAAELLIAQLGLSATIVPYRGVAPAFTDLAAGHVRLGLLDVSPALPLFRAGTLLALAVTSLTRALPLPEVPTIDETLIPDFEAVAWTAIYAPAGTPAPVVDVVNGAIREAVGRASVQQRFAESGGEIAVGSPVELADFMRRDIARWAEVARANRLSFD